MNNPFSYVEIPVTDMQRAVNFYQGAFGFELELTVVDGNQMALFHDQTGAVGVSGALAKGDSYVPSKTGPRVYLFCADIEDRLQHIESLGGQVAYPKTEVEAWGWVAEFIDSEGNQIALHQPK